MGLDNKYAQIISQMNEIEIMSNVNGNIYLKLLNNSDNVIISDIDTDKIKIYQMIIELNDPTQIVCTENENMNDDLSFIEYINKYTKITKQRSITGESSKRLSSILINNKLLIRENDFKLFSDDFTLIQIISVDNDIFLFFELNADI
jgi:hypothetical protein